MHANIDRRLFLGSASATAGLALLPGCAPTAATIPTTGLANASPTETLARIAEEMLAEYPESATSLGLDKGERVGLKSKLTDRSMLGRSIRALAANRRLAEARTVAASNAPASVKLDAQVTAAAHEIAVEGYRFPFGDVVNLDPNLGYRNAPYVVAQNTGAFIEIPDFLDSKHVIETQADAQAYVARVEDYATALDGETGRLAHDRGLGVVAPSFLLDKTLKILRGGRAEAPASTVLVTSLAKRAGEKGLPATSAQAVEALVRQRLMPALDRQIAELEKHRAQSNDNAGVWDLPDGGEYYRWALKAATTTNLSPQEIHTLGREQLKLVQDRMDGILRKAGFTKGSVGARMTALAKDPAQLFPNTDAGRAELLGYLNELVAGIRARMPQAFATLVPGNLVIKRVPIAIEVGAPGGYAGPGTIDGSVPGAYYINLRDTARWPKFGLPTLTYHEGIPGHIWQGEYTFKLPLVRSLLAFNAYSEGWALYAEQLADELGMYADNPLAVLGYLQANAFRCCRLVVDTGLHELRWSRTQAIRWFAEANGSGEDEVQSEVDRYCAWPGQACGYKIGQIEIVRLRDKAKAALGERYDFRQFNDAVVLGGAVPLTLLTRDRRTHRQPSRLNT